MCVGCARTVGAKVGERVLQMKNHQVARIDAQVGGFPAGCIGVAITHSAIRIRGIVSGQLHFQNTLLALQVFRLFDSAPRLGPRA